MSAADDEDEGEGAREIHGNGEQGVEGCKALMQRQCCCCCCCCCRRALELLEWEEGSEVELREDLGARENGGR